MYLRAVVFVLSVAALQIQAADTRDPVDSIVASLRAQKYDEALTVANGALQHSPNDYRLITLRGVSLAHLGKVTDSVTAFNRALVLSPNYVPALEGLAEAEYKSGGKEALHTLRRLVDLRPQEQMAHAMLGVVEYRTRDCSAAAQDFKLAGSAIYHQPVAVEQFADCLIALKLPSEAIQTLQPITATASPDADALDVLSTAYEALGDTPHAVETLRHCILLAPHNVGYYLDFADLSLIHSSPQVGVDVLSEGLKLIPQASQLYLARGVLLVQMAEYERAESDFETAQLLDPAQSVGMEARELGLLQQNNLDEALKAIRSELQKHPRDAFLHYLFAEALLRRGALPASAEFDQAIKSAVEATKLDPRLVLAHNLLSLLYTKSGNLHAAIDESRVSLKIDPSDQTALYHLILALRQSGEKDEIPSLVKRLSALREEERRQQNYRLLEVNSPQPKTADQE